MPTFETYEDIAHDPELCDHTRATVDAVVELGHPEILAKANESELYKLAEATAIEGRGRFAGHELADRAPAVREIVARRVQLQLPTQQGADRS
jgi:hypothetical protein